MINVILFVLMILNLILSRFFYEITGGFFVSICLIMVNFILAFIIVNSNRLNVNLINLQSIFMSGFFVFFLGRFVGVLVDKNYLSITFCLDFIFNYCSVDSEILYLFFILNVVLISFSFAFLFNVNRRDEKVTDNFHIMKSKLRFIILLLLISTSISYYQQLQAIVIAINSGYMALYATQAEAYQTPFAMLFSVLSGSCLALLYSLRGFVNKKVFYFILGFYILGLLLGVATGSRASFISGIILFLWVIFNDVRIKNYMYIIFLGLGFFLVGIINKLASLSGARPFEESNGIVNSIGDTFYSQGVTLMVFNSSLYVENYPILGAVKSLIPGIQIIYPFFGVINRYEFDWSSYMTYFENKGAYETGFGLGWSIYSDFYILSMGFVPLFCILIFLFGRLIVFISNSHSYYSDGLKFIMVASLFSINRGQLSPLLFSFFIYTILCLVVGTLRVKRYG